MVVVSDWGTRAEELLLNRHKVLGTRSRDLLCTTEPVVNNPVFYTYNVVREYILG